MTLEQTKTLQPFLKWPGGKRRVLPELRQYIPENFETYFEGFLGGGALLFDLMPDKAKVSDVNIELITAYKTIKSNATEVLERLGLHESITSLDYFLEVRAWDRDDSYDGLSDVEKTARMIYINKTCFNGLYRVNQKGQFNAHYGHYANPLIMDTVGINAISAWMDSIDIVFSTNGYKSIIDDAGLNDFVYLDPPYIPLSETASFTKYSKDGFDDNDQVELRDKALEVDSRGGYVLLSNSDTPRTRELYDDFRIIPINVKRSIGASSHTRKKVGEVLILGKNLAKEKGLL